REHHASLRSFPTRRSSDLRQIEVLRQFKTRSSSGVLLNVEHRDPVPQGVVRVLERFHAQPKIQLEPSSNRPIILKVEAEIRSNRSEEHTSELQSRSDLVCR